MTITSKIVVVAAVASVLGASAAGAATTPTLKCQTGKLKAVGSFSSCLFKAEAKAVTSMLTPDFSKCQEKINDKFPKLEATAGAGICPSEMDLVDIRTRTEDFESDIAILLAGGSLTTTTSTTTTTTLPAGSCGNAILESGEDCDAGQLGGQTCATQGFFNGTLDCGPGCTFDTSGCNLTRFVDTGNTIQDNQTGLEWEKKTGVVGSTVTCATNTDCADPHNVNNAYAWAASGSAQSGVLWSNFLTRLNGTVDHPTTTTSGCFENHCDWRVPTVDELKGIWVSGCGVAPCIVDAEFAPNRSGRYWSSSTRVASPTGAYFVDFTSPTLVASDVKTTSYFARAVRKF